MKIGEVRYYVRLADGSFVARDRNRSTPTRDLAFAFTARSHAWAWIETAEWGGGALDRVDVVGVRSVPSKTLDALREAAIAYVEEGRKIRDLEAAFYSAHPELLGASWDKRSKHPDWPSPEAWSGARSRLELAVTNYAEKRLKSRAAVEAIAQAARERIAAEIAEEPF